MKVLLDTNTYTALFRAHDGVAQRVRRAEQVLVSAIVAGELAPEGTIVNEPRRRAAAPAG